MAVSFSKKLEEGNNLLIVDGFNLAFRWLHVHKTKFAMDYLNTVTSFANSYKASKVVVLSDGGSNYRQNLFPEYKSTRKEMRANQSQEDSDNFEEFMEEWKVAFDLVSSEFIGIRYPGVEADDIAAYLSSNKDIHQKFNHIWCLSTDRDWNLLISDKVSQFSYRTRKEYTLENWGQHYTYDLEDHLGIKVLQGDKSDSIPGVAGVGEKRAANLIREYGSIYDIIAAIPIDDKKAFIQNLNKSKDQLIVNLELMDLVAFSEEAIGENIEDLNERVKEIIS